MICLSIFRLPKINQNPFEPFSRFLFNKLRREEKPLHKTNYEIFIEKKNTKRNEFFFQFVEIKFIF